MTIDKRWQLKCPEQVDKYTDNQLFDNSLRTQFPEPMRSLDLRNKNRKHLIKKAKAIKK